MKNFIIILAFLCLHFNYCCGLESFFDHNLKHGQQASDVKAFEQAVREHDFYNVCLHRTKKLGDPLLQPDQILVDKIFNDIHGAIINRRREYPDQFIFVLFSECFFGEDEPLNDEIASYLIEKCRLLTQERRVLLQMCMLHKFNINAPPNWLQGEYNPIKSRRNLKKRIVRVDGENKNKAKLAKHFLIANEKHPNRLANYVLSFVDGKIAAIYRKSTYYEEADKYIHTTYSRAKYAYEFGDLQSHPVENSPFARFFIGKKPLVATRICSDMNPQYLKFDPSTKLILVHSSGHPMSGYADCRKFMIFTDDQGIAFTLPDGKKTGIIWENLREMNGYVFGCFDLSILKDLPNIPYYLIRLRCIQHEIK